MSIAILNVFTIPLHCERVASRIFWRFLMLPLGGKNRCCIYTYHVQNALYIQCSESLLSNVVRCFMPLRVAGSIQCACLHWMHDDCRSCEVAVLGEHASHAIESHPGEIPHTWTCCGIETCAQTIEGVQVWHREEGTGCHQ